MAAAVQGADSMMMANLVGRALAFYKELHY